jgi:hypothetical protein
MIPPVTQATGMLTRPTSQTRKPRLRICKVAGPVQASWLTHRLAISRPVPCQASSCLGLHSHWESAITLLQPAKDKEVGPSHTASWARCLVGSFSKKAAGLSLSQALPLPSTMYTWGHPPCGKWHSLGPEWEAEARAQRQWPQLTCLYPWAHTEPRKQNPEPRQASGSISSASAQLNLVFTSSLGVQGPCWTLKHRLLKRPSTQSQRLLADSICRHVSLKSRFSGTLTEAASRLHLVSGNVRLPACDPT